MRVVTNLRVQLLCVVVLLVYAAIDSIAPSYGALSKVVIRDAPTRKKSITTGTAFAVDNAGTWVTARHIIDGCKEIYLALDQTKLDQKKSYPFILDSKGKNRTYVVKAALTFVDNKTDLAILTTSIKHNAPLPLAIPSPRAEPSYKQAVAVGYPASKPGEILSSFLGANIGILHFGKTIVKQTILSWSIADRNPFSISLSGISGGPILNTKGEVIGVIIGQNIRRGRIYTSTPHALAHTLASNKLALQQTRPTTTVSFNKNNYSNYANNLRQQDSVVQVYCPNLHLN